MLRKVGTLKRPRSCSRFVSTDIPRRPSRREPLLANSARCVRLASMNDRAGEIQAEVAVARSRCGRNRTAACRAARLRRMRRGRRRRRSDRTAERPEISVRSNVAIALSTLAIVIGSASCGNDWRNAAAYFSCCPEPFEQRAIVALQSHFERMLVEQRLLHLPLQCHDAVARPRERRVVRDVRERHRAPMHAVALRARRRARGRR